MSWFTWVRGLRRIRRGYCPECYSSPPRPDCVVCDGERQYGLFLREPTRELWQWRWVGLRAVRNGW